MHMLFDGLLSATFRRQFPNVEPFTISCYHILAIITEGGALHFAIVEFLAMHTGDASHCCGTSFPYLCRVAAQRNHKLAVTAERSSFGWTRTSGEFNTS